MTFMKTFWAALLAFVVANILIIIFFVFIIASVAVFMGDSVPTVKKETVLKLDLSGGVTDAPDYTPFSSVGLGGVVVNNSNSILQMISAIEKAALDDNVKGIYINVSGGASMAILEELRAALEEFKESGKFIVAYSDYYTQGEYYLASVADMVFINPQGDLLWKGLASNVMFYKGLLDKLGIEAQILRHGTFKSAVEPFMLERMSPENRLQTSTMLETIWNTVLHDVSMSRGIDTDVLFNYATDLAIRSAERAVEYGMVDAAIYEDQVMEILALASKRDMNLKDAYYQVISKSGNMDTPEEAKTEMATPERDIKPEIMSFGQYISASQAYGRNISKNKVAVVYADGDIIDGESVTGSVGGNTIAQKLAKARKDDNVKAVVLRVNSPGGSALASEVIWREMELVRKVKPVIVSMGSMAASGGYYISCPADVIISDRTTLTGSIGVFGLMMDFSKGLKNKLGITVDVVKTNPSGDLGSPFRSLSPRERDAIMYSVENVYTTFVDHVAEGRNMTFDEVDNIGQGRVWSGTSALDIGLVDGHGGLMDAITLAADRAGVIENFRVWEVVDEPDSFSVLLKQIGSIRAASQKDELAEVFLEYKSLLNMVRENGTVQARMPYLLEIW